MEETTGYSAYAMFQAVKLHFTSDYDYFRYNGKTNVSKESFMHNKSKYSFYKLSRKYSIDELRNFYVANFVEGSVNWIGELTGPEAEESYKKWQKRNQSLTYRFQQDIMLLLDRIEDPNELLKVHNGQYPKLLMCSMEQEIAIETLIIMNDIMGFFPMWKKKIQDNIIWPSYNKKCEKYSPFLIYDKKKYKNILLESIQEYA